MSLRVLTSKILKVFVLFLVFAGLIRCGGDSGSGGLNIDAGVFGPATWGEPDTFRGAGVINDSKFVFAGPLSRGENGDILLQNDHVRVIIQKPGRSAGVGMFGGNIIDADRFRPSSEPGQDQFGVLFPLINLSWTANYQRLEILNADFASGPVVIRATGGIDVYDYIQTNIIGPFAKIFAGADLTFADQFDDILNPFKNLPTLRNLAPIVVTDYTLASDSAYVIMETKFMNTGEEPIKMPVGDWVNGSGTLELFVPKNGFVRTPQVDNSTALIYQGLEDNVGVSYGYFYNPIQFIKEDGTLPAAASLSVSGVTPMVLGESSLLNIIPVGNAEPKINFTVDPGVRTITRYFVIGSGDIASVMDEGFKALGISKLRLSGKVEDSGGNPVTRARVIVLDEGNPVTVAFSDASGNFAADISSGTDAKDKLFGSGTYTVEVYKEGFLQGGGPKAGKCTGGSLDAGAKVVSGVQCKLGSSGKFAVSASDGSGPIPARVTVVGFDPSPFHDAGAPAKFGKYRDINLEERPYGIVDMFYLDPEGHLRPDGNHRILGGNEFRIEPGEYEVFVTRGPEYSVFKQRVTVSAGGTTAVNANLNKVIDTSGYVAVDLHLHSIQSADSVWGLDSRVRAAMAEGMDVILSTDHDYITDYQPVIDRLGVGHLLTSMVGDEITPLAIGHMLAFPLQADPNSPTGGAYDYTYVPATDDIINPDHDLIQTLTQIIQGVDQANGGTQVFQMAHILDKATGNFAISGLVTSPAFSDQVQPLSSYGDPVNFRMPSNSNEGGGFQAPFPMGTSGMFSPEFNSIELIVGAYPDIYEHLMQSALPTYFNLLNLGLIKTATASSDSHTQVREPMGTPRTYIASSVDPRDGLGSSFAAIDREELAVNTNAHRLIVSNGVFIKASLKSASNPGGVTVGGTISGTGDVTLELEITSNEYFDWDRVEIYANTEPIPAKDDMSGLTDLTAEEFHKNAGGHTIKYLLSPLFQFFKTGSGDAALNQSTAGGVRKAILSRGFNFSQDTWIVVMVRGSNNVRSLFPYVTKGADTDVAQGNFLDTLDNNPTLIGGVRAFAFTNPMFVDVDGNGFIAKHVQSGISPITP